jgi:hypothetical protein
MAAISLPAWKQVKSGRSFHAHGPLLRVRYRAGHAQGDARGGHANDMPLHRLLLILTTIAFRTRPSTSAFYSLIPYLIVEDNVVLIMVIFLLWDRMTLSSISELLRIAVFSTG